MNSEKFRLLKTKTKEKTTNPRLRDSETPRLQDPSAKNIRDSETQKSRRKRDFQTHQKCFRDFEIGPKFSDINIYTRYIQNFASRITTSTRKYDHITQVLKELKWLLVATQLYLRNAIMAFKCLAYRVPEYLSSQFIKRGEISRRTTRGSRMLNIPLFKTASGQRTFYYIIASVWNSMDNSYLKTLESAPAFKFNLKRKLVKDYIDS